MELTFLDVHSTTCALSQRIMNVYSNNLNGRIRIFFKIEEMSITQNCIPSIPVLSAV